MALILRLAAPLVWKAGRQLRRREGQGMVEYAMILILASVIVIVILFTMGNQVQNVFSNVACALGANCPTPHQRDRG
jgi:pilus assembly protein Flp/PilA